MGLSARYLAESMYYRGNGAIDIWTDTDYLNRLKHDRSLRDRNVILFGNADDNSAWKELLAKCPIKVAAGLVGLSGSVTGKPRLTNQGVAALITYPMPGSSTALIGAFGMADSSAIDILERLPILPSGAAYPDWVVFNSSSEPASGTRSVVVAGDFAPDWQMPDAMFVARPRTGQSASCEGS